MTSEEEPVSIAQYVSNVKIGEKKAIVSGGDSDSDVTYDHAHFPPQVDEARTDAIFTGI